MVLVFDCVCVSGTLCRTVVSAARSFAHDCILFLIVFPTVSESGLQMREYIQGKVPL